MAGSTSGGINIWRDQHLAVSTFGGHNKRYQHSAVSTFSRYQHFAQRPRLQQAGLDSPRSSRIYTSPAISDSFLVKETLFEQFEGPSGGAVSIGGSPSGGNNCPTKSVGRGSVVSGRLIGLSVPAFDLFQRQKCAHKKHKLFL